LSLSSERRETVEHPFGTIKARMGATHFLMRRCQRDGAAVLAYNLTRVISIVGFGPLLAAMSAAAQASSVASG
jgi:hypothetical protein